MAALIDLHIGGRVYPVACREGEEANLRAAAQLVDEKCREALAGLGTLSKSRQFMFAALLLADQMLEGSPVSAPAPEATPAPLPSAPPPAPLQPAIDPGLVLRAEALATSLELLAMRLENGADAA